VGAISLNWQLGQVAGLLPAQVSGDLPTYQPTERRTQTDIRAQYAKLQAWYRMQSLLLSKRADAGGSPVR